MSDRQRERDLVLAPNEYAFISDQTKGNINVYVGPYKTSLANTDQPVYFDAQSKRFVWCTLEESIKVFSTAPEGWYLVMKNPAKSREFPTSGTVNNLTPLEVGHKVNIPGPTSCALWPGQMARVVKGHHIRSNQYLVVRVYDEEAALKSWGEGVVKLQEGASEEQSVLSAEQPKLTIGERLIIDGNSVSFYIPPTGVEVVRDQEGAYVRDAVTLERLEYCILLDEDGQKRFIQGPAVVFPKPTERFVTREGMSKFRAIELNELSGLYIKVIAAYEEGEARYEVGQELFITGREQMIYVPRPEHAIIRYGKQELHHAVAIPAGEGRYVMNRETGHIRLVKGPTMFLADPRKEVMIRRVLTDEEVQLWFPNNEEALSYNRMLRERSEGRGPGHVPSHEMSGSERGSREAGADEPSKRAPRKKQGRDERFGGDEISRKSTFSEPRTLTLNTKYDGAVTISLWTGYAAQVVSKTGSRKVIVGPQTYQLEYDESLEAMTLSTGTPKRDARPLKTSYLRALHNKISDIVEAETQDLCQVKVTLSYRVNFEGEPERWFNVENYVRFLTDHMRSIIRNAVKKRGVEAFYNGSTELLRDTVLGTAEEGKGRPGRRFEENGMHIYDLEVLDVRLSHGDIERLLMEAQHSTVQQTIALNAERQRRDMLVEQEQIKRELEKLKVESQLLKIEQQLLTSQKELTLELQQQQRQAEVSEVTLQRSLKEEGLRKSIQEGQLSRAKAESDYELAVEREQQAVSIERLEAEVKAMVAKAGAVSPDLIAALQAFSDKALVEKVSASMSPLAILGGKSVADVVQKLLRGTPLERTLEAWSEGSLEPLVMAPPEEAVGTGELEEPEA